MNRRYKTEWYAAIELNKELYKLICFWSIVREKGFLRFVCWKKRFNIGLQMMGKEWESGGRKRLAVYTHNQIDWAAEPL